MAGEGGVGGGEQLADAVTAQVKVTVVAVVPEQRKYRDALFLGPNEISLTCYEC